MHIAILQVFISLCVRHTSLYWPPLLPTLPKLSSHMEQRQVVKRWMTDYWK
jgi:hypothetical protein